MGFEVLTEQRSVPGAGTQEIVVLREQSGAARALVCPALGFNCFSWEVRGAAGPVDLLHAEPDFLQGLHNTRSGCPILFPFPNRIREGRFSWNGKNYSIPRNDAPHENAIHGFVCQRAWKVTDQRILPDEALVEAQFQGSVQAPETLAWWPADYLILATWRLSRSALGLDLTVRNPDRTVLPFGVGVHPYFRLSENDTVQAFAKKYWELENMLPTGRTLPVTPRCDLNQPRPFHELQLDDVLTDLSSLSPVRGGEGLGARGSWTAANLRVGMLASPVFREVVVFTPGNRQSFCLEPYTCTTDAINLQQRGIDAGLLTLNPGEEWSATVVVEVEAQ